MEDLDELLEIGKLEDMLKNNATRGPYGVLLNSDRTLRFAPIETYRFGDHTPGSLATDSSIIARFGVRGARKLGTIAEKFKEKPCIWGPGANKDPFQSVCVITGHGDRLKITSLYSTVGNAHAYGRQHRNAAQKTPSEVIDITRKAPTETELDPVDSMETVRMPRRYPSSPLLPAPEHS